MAILFVDGENFRKSILSIFLRAKRNKPELYRYDFRGLFEKVLSGIRIDRKIFYFARIEEHSETREKSKQLIAEQRLLKTHLEKQGFEVILAGRVRAHMEKIPGALGQKVRIFKEKGVDVRLAVNMVSWACDKKFDQAVIASSDSDLQPAIHELGIRKISRVYLGFEDDVNKGLTYTTDKTILIRNSEVFEFEKARAVK